MGLGFSKVFVNENDISFYVDSLQKGLSCVEGKTERGPVNKAIYISSNVLQTAKQKRMLNATKAEVYTVPDYYFETELREAGELC